MTTTLSDMARRVAREITEVLDGTATAGAATTLTDTLLLTQQNQYWDRGTLWIRSGTHIGKVVVVTGFSAGKLTFPTLTTTIGTPTYSVARGTFPYPVLQQAVNSALDEIRVTQTDETLAGDGSTLEFTLPAGVAGVERVELDAAGYSPAWPAPSHHWKERGGKIKFDYGFPPGDGDTIRLYYKDYHDALVDYDDTVHEDVNLEWLKWKACEHALYWGIKTYQNAKEYRLEELMNKVLERQKGLLPTPLTVRLRTAGA